MKIDVSTFSRLRARRGGLSGATKWVAITADGEPDLELTVFGQDEYVEALTNAINEIADREDQKELGEMRPIAQPPKKDTFNDDDIPF